MGDFAAVYAKWVNDRDAIWGLTHVGPRNHLLDGVKVGESICCHGGGGDKKAIWPFVKIFGRPVTVCKTTQSIY